jgi:hypothetical protein
MFKHFLQLLPRECNSVVILILIIVCSKYNVFKKPLAYAKSCSGWGMDYKTGESRLVFPVYRKTGLSRFQKPIESVFGKNRS